MDLVDIDKVLDDFELNESQKIESATINGGSCTPKRTDNNSLQPQGSSEPDNSEDNSKNDRAKKYVSLPVSHVFSSLDDYQRDVQSLTKEVNIKENILKDNEHLKNSQPDITPISSGGEGRATDIHPEEKMRSPSEDDPTDYFQDEAECVTSASSITTSSPSSFSSGPCPGSSSESGSFISEPEKKNFPDDSEKAKNNKSNEDSKEISQDNNADSEYKAENGPSFVSSCQYNENISSSILGFSQDIKTDDQCTISSEVQNSDKIAEQTSFSFQGELTNNENDESVLKNYVPKSKLDVSVVGGRVVGFSSTMDEISDTELDSLLQDIDNDLQVFSSQSNNNEVDVMLTETLATKGSEIDFNSSNGEVSHAKKITKNDDYLQNADSISQASTVEFAEIRLQSDFGTDTLEDDKDTTSNSGTRSEIKSIEATIQDSGSEKLAKLEKEDEKDNQESTNLSINKIELDQPTTTKQPLQRPNSLDLSNQTSEEVNINSTAGQTPPASRLDDASLLSSSSSGEIPQNLSGDGDAQDVWPPEEGSECDNVIDNSKLGKEPPFWVPDSEANACMQCKQKFSLIKRRHHCRACGQVLCSACCSQKAKLEFLADTEARVCVQCHLILSERISPDGNVEIPQSSNSMQARSPNPNNPMEYCSVIPPLQQVSQGAQCPISVMVPVGVLKREGSSKSNRKDKTVIFSDGIRPGCDLTELDNNWNTDGKSMGDSGSTGYRKSIKREQTPPGVFPSGSQRANRANRQLLLGGEVESFIPKEPNALPPIHIASKGEYIYKGVQNDGKLIEQLQHETLKFAIHQNFYVFLKIVDLKCCINKTIINFTTLGMHHVGQDEIVILLQLDNLETIPKDIFIHLYEIYRNADKGHPVPELGYSIPKVQKFLGCKNNGGFLYIRSTFQCLQEIHLPEPPFLIGILIHQWEMPWAKIFPLRLMLRLGAEYRYYPSPHISVRDRDPVYGEISHTIINFLADFRNYSYTIPTIKGMYIHMEVRKTSISIPKNRYDQVLKAVNNSSDHILAFGGNFSKKADGHLVCIQNMQSDSPETWTYSTQAINIQGQPRKITGASFIVLNGALKTSTGLSGKCSIVEDGLMVQILPSKMVSVRAALKDMQDSEIICGPVDADENQVEVVSIKWTDNDLEFNVGVKSPIDSKPMDGHPSIRVHSGLNFSNTNHTIRWTEVFIIQRWDEETARAKDSIDMSKLSEQIAKSTSKALVPFLDLLATSGYLKLGLRATLHQDNVCYEAGSQNQKLAPLYMNALDNELIPTLHKQATSLEIDSTIILELIFHILDK